MFAISLWVFDKLENDVDFQDDSMRQPIFRKPNVGARKTDLGSIDKNNQAMKIIANRSNVQIV